METNKQINWLNDEINNQEEVELYSEKCVVGLMEVISGCKTPFNISLQGEWGSGKTTLINKLKQKIKVEKKEIGVLEFDVLKLARVEESGAIFYIFASSLINQLKIDNKVDDKKEKFLSNLKNILYIVEKPLEKLTSINLNELFGRYLECYQNEEKGDFDYIVQKYLEHNKLNKIVLFIDNLDRLDPVQALEFIENLKTFLDCKNLVNFIAIDFDIVAKGVKRKYDDVDYIKSTQFFEKYFQLSFKMPQHKYKMIDYIKRHSENNNNFLKIPQSLYFPLEDFFHSISFNNPRSLKKILNELLLLNMIERSPIQYGNFYRLIALVIESKNIELYNKIIDKQIEFIPNEEIEKNVQKEYENLINLISNMNEKTLKEFKKEFIKTRSSSKEVIGLIKQNHSVNVEVQKIIRKIFNDISTNKEYFDINCIENFGKEKERKLDINHEELKNLYAKIVLTEGKGQGLFLERADKKFKVYFSGDYNGTIMNSNLQILNYNTNKTIEVIPWKNKYKAEELLNNEEVYKEFLFQLIKNIKHAEIKE